MTPEQFDWTFRHVVLPIVLVLGTVGLVGSVWIVARETIRDIRDSLKRGC